MLCTTWYWLSIASVCLSVTHFRYRYRAHIGWNSSKIISRPNTLRLMRWLTQHGRSGATGTPQNYGRIEVGQEHIKAVISQKWSKIGPRLLLQTNRKSHTRFRLAPKSMTSDDLERPKRHSCKNKQNFQNLNSFRIKSAQRSPIVAVSESKIRMNNLYSASRGHLCDNKAFFIVYR